MASISLWLSEIRTVKPQNQMMCKVAGVNKNDLSLTSDKMYVITGSICDFKVT